MVAKSGGRKREGVLQERGTPGRDAGAGAGTGALCAGVGAREHNGRGDT